MCARPAVERGPSWRNTLAVVVARCRVPALVAGVLIVAAAPLHGSERLGWAGVGLILGSVATSFVRGLAVRREPIAVASPVRGRWLAVNSPADRVPSHGVHSGGQTYAIDLVHWPDRRERWRALHWWPLVRRPEEFPGFGEPVLAPADGRVVAARDGWRDHLSRNSPPALAYGLVEGSLRELLGPGALLGNHVVLELGDGAYAVLAHLKRRSVLVSPGQAVSTGEQLAECGNSGNTSEPHLHLQLMDTAHPAFAAGLPFEFRGTAMPRREEPLAGAGAEP